MAETTSRIKKRNPQDKSTKTNINILGLPEIIQGIFENQQTGTLRVQSADNQVRYIYFHQGKIRFVGNPQRPSLLAEALRHTPLEIEEQTLEQIFQRFADGEDLLAILLDMQISDHEGIAELISFQIIEDLWEIFDWPKPFCEFGEDPPPAEIAPPAYLELPIAVNPESLLMESARRLDEWRLCQEILPSLHDIPVLNSAAVPEELSAEEGVILPLIDGQHDLAEILEAVPLPRLETFKYLCQYARQGLISLKTPHSLLALAADPSLQDNEAKRIKLYERVEEQGLIDIEALQWLAQAYERTSQLDSCIAKYWQLGQIFWERGEYERAASAYMEVVTYAPDRHDAYEKLFTALEKSGQGEEAARIAGDYAHLLAKEDRQQAIALLKRAQALYPHNPDNYELLALLYLETNDPVEAILTYEQLAKLYHRLGDTEKEISAYSRILNLDPANIASHMALANVLINAGRHEEGVERYKIMAEMLYQSGVFSDARKCQYLTNAYETIIRYEPQNVKAREELANIYLQQQKTSQARTVLQDLITLLQRKGDPAALITNIKKYLELEPHHFAYHRQLADCYLQLEQKEKARDWYLVLASAAMAAGEVQQARQALDAALSLDAFNLAGRRKYCELLENLQDNEEAAQSYHLVGHLFQALAKYDEAISAFSKALELSPQQPRQLLLTIAKLYEKLDKKNLAIFHYRRFIMTSLKQGNYGDAWHGCQFILTLAPDDQNIQNLQNSLAVLLEEKQANLRIEETEDQVNVIDNDTGIEYCF